MARSGNGSSVVSRVVRILDAFTPETPVLGVSEIARRTGLHVATASRIVEELVRHGLCGSACGCGTSPRPASPTQDLRKMAMPVMEVLQATVGHHTQLGVLDGEDVIFAERLQAPRAVINFTRLAGWLPLHASSSGVVLLAHWCTILLSVVLDGSLMHPWSPPGHRHGRSTFEVQREFCEVRWPRTPRPATGLCAVERRSVSDRLRGPGTTGCSPTAPTARKQL